GNGVVSAFTYAMEQFLSIQIDIVNYQGHSLDRGTDSQSMSYIETKDTKGNHYFGAAISHSVGRSSVKAVVSAINKMLTA
ncbi:MAG: alpha-isopropylmalate synthase regulatory domain-containing protein, partial [Eubacteriales bacterium]